MEGSYKQAEIPAPHSLPGLEEIKMPKEGFEPSILAELRPERSVYTNFTTSAEFFRKEFEEKFFKTGTV